MSQVSRLYHLLLKGVDRLVVFIPILLMTVLALGSYWLVRNAPVAKASAADRVLTHDPDYFLKKFSVKTFTPEGKLKSELFGEIGKHYPDTDTIEIESIRIHNFNEVGRLTAVTTSNHGISNGDNSEVQLYGDAKSIRKATVDADGKPLPQLEIKGEFLHVFVNDERLKSHLPVTLVRGKSTIRGNAFEYDNLSRVASFQGSVNAILHPAKSTN